MLEFLANFEGMPGRLMKYLELLLLGEDASPFCYQDSMSYRRLAIAITTYCNLKCKWCYRHDSQYQGVLNKHIRLEVLRNIVSNTEGHFRLIHLAGLGEPLLYPNLAEAIRIVREKSDNVKITTNGTLLTPQKVDEIVAAGLTHIELSVDAFSMDKLTEFRGSDLRQIVGMIKYISNETKLFLQINSVVASLNYNALFNIVDVLKEAKNIKVIHTIPLFMTEQLRNDKCKKVSDEDYISLLDKIEKDIKANRLDWKVQPSAYGVSIDPVIEMKRQKNICFSCFEDPFINTDGYLCPCPRREFDPLHDAIGGLEKAMNSQNALEYRKNMLKGNYPEFCGEICFLKEKKGNVALRTNY